VYATEIQVASVVFNNNNMKNCDTATVTSIPASFTIHVMSLYLFDLFILEKIKLATKISDREK